MKTRIMAAVILLPALFLIVLAAPASAASAILGILLAIAAYELLYRTGLVQNARLVIYSALMAFCISMWSYMEAVRAYFLVLLLLFFMLLFAEMMIDHIKVRIEMLGLCFLAGVIIPYMLSALIRILMLNVGRFVILIPFIIAFTSDAGAYFIGVRFGRHKLAPVVSPNKSIEGVLGGIASSVISILLYAVILDLLPVELKLNYGVALLYGFVGSIVGTFGDLCFSIIKRQTGIKDYGSLIPGHGGALDRFDSLTVVAPLMETMLLLIPIISV